MTIKQIQDDTGPMPYVVHSTDDDDERTWFLQFRHHRPGYNPSQLSHAVMKWRINSFQDEQGDSEEGYAFFVMDLAYVHRQYMTWQTIIPQAKPYYAVKCNTDELRKIKQIYPQTQLFLRIYALDATAKTNLNIKFGASLKSAKDLLHAAKDLDLAVTVLSFHVGSGASDPIAFETAIRGAREVFDYAIGLGFNMSSLDMGGGFTEDQFLSIGPRVRRSLDKHFKKGTIILAEPGRYFVAGAMTLACNVIARRDIDETPSILLSYMLYLNDGIYGNFLRYVFEKPSPTPSVLYTDGEFFPQNRGGTDEQEAKTYVI